MDDDTDPSDKSKRSSVAPEETYTSTEEAAEPMGTLWEESISLYNHMINGPSEQQSFRLETEVQDPHFFYITQEFS